MSPHPLCPQTPLAAALRRSPSHCRRRSCPAWISEMWRRPRLAETPAGQVSEQNLHPVPAEGTHHGCHVPGALQHPTASGTGPALVLASVLDGPAPFSSRLSLTFPQAVSAAHTSFPSPGLSPVGISRTAALPAQASSQGVILGPPSPRSALGLHESLKLSSGPHPLLPTAWLGCTNSGPQPLATHTPPPVEALGMPPLGSLRPPGGPPWSRPSLPQCQEIPGAAGGPDQETVVEFLEWPGPAERQGRGRTPAGSLGSTLWSRVLCRSPLGLSLGGGGCPPRSALTAAPPAGPLRWHGGGGRCPRGCHLPSLSRFRLGGRAGAASVISPPAPSRGRGGPGRGGTEDPSEEPSP